eukprot:TRINITY_DN7578_c0_g2_i3.p1 TRINITY_DN7578_c0_g2~~TRINITY_DN7578_c0_g2_i3.p1  ORF type:complete len:136 (-),score=13.43 TRINITY_DN7578_c0_g2_i3:103-510(-)
MLLPWPAVAHLHVRQEFLLPHLFQAFLRTHRTEHGVVDRCGSIARAVGPLCSLLRLLQFQRFAVRLCHGHRQSSRLSFLFLVALFLFFFFFLLLLNLLLSPLSQCTFILFLHVFFVLLLVLFVVFGFLLFRIRVP